MVKRFFLLLFVLNLSFFSQSIYSEENQVVINKIVIEGNQRVTDATVLSYSDISEGDIFTDQIGQRIIKDLYDTGYFDDISLRVDENTLVITFTENSAAANSFIGGAGDACRAPRQFLPFRCSVAQGIQTDMCIQSEIALGSNINVQKESQHQNDRPSLMVGPLIVLHGTHRRWSCHGGCGCGAEREI